MLRHAGLDYVHVDVFAARPYAGNSLPVFVDAQGLDSSQMLAISRELRHFETVFLTSTSESERYGARIFDLFEELPFAGHPLIGAAAALHRMKGDDGQRLWTFDLAEKTVTVDSRSSGNGYSCLLDQGPAEFLGEIGDRDRVAKAFGLSADDLDPVLPLEVISTGLRYLIVPVRRDGLDRASITTDITNLVEDAGAQFAVLLDAATLEIRHWNNDGVLEDIATGSAAGTIGAYRLRHCGAASGTAFVLHQGRHVGRPSQLVVEPLGTADAVRSVKVGGEVAIVGRGHLEVRP